MDNEILSALKVTFGIEGRDNFKENVKNSDVLKTAHKGEKGNFFSYIESNSGLIDTVDSFGNTVLHIACCTKEREALVDSIIKHFPRLVHTNNKTGVKPIHYAAYFNNKKTFPLLLKIDKKLINAVDDNGDTVLHFACYKTQNDGKTGCAVAKQIADRYPHLLYETNKYDYKPIHYAAYYGNAEVFWYFVNKDESFIDVVKETDKDGNTFLHKACIRYNNVDATDFAKQLADLAIQIADKYPHLMHIKNNDGYKPIYYAVKHWGLPIFWSFVYKDQNLIKEVDKDGNTVLHNSFLLENCSTSFAKRLADEYPYLLHEPNNYGFKPIHFAVYYGKASAFWYFIEKDGSLINAVDKDGNTVLHKACRISNKTDRTKKISNLAKQIAKKYPDLLQKINNDGCKPVLTAAESGNSIVFWYFIDKDESLINAVDKNGDTVLHKACFKSNLAITIVKKYAHLLHKKNNDGLKAILYAADCGNADVFWCFIDKDKSLIDAVDKDGRTVLHRAIRSTELGTVDLAKEIARKYPHLVKIKDNEGRKL